MRSWKAFKANRKAYFSLILFSGIFISSLFAEFIANENPLLVYKSGRWYFPIYQSYLETDFGQQFPLVVDFRDPVIQEDIVKHSGWILWPLFRYGENTVSMEITEPPPSKPTTKNWLGVDDQGRDILVRIIYAIRTSCLFGITLGFAEIILGIIMGAIQGYFAGKVDLLIQRGIEIWESIPSFLVLLIVSSFFVPSFWTLILILLPLGWMTTAANVRTEFLRSRNLNYVRSARSLGVSNLLIIWRHILPNALVSTLALAPYTICGNIAAMTTLDFLGLGMPPGTATLGELIDQGKSNLFVPSIAIVSFLATVLIFCLFVFIGEGVRDALDPKRSAA